MSTDSDKENLKKLKGRIISGFSTVRAYRASLEPNFVLPENRFSDMLCGRKPMPDGLMKRIKSDLKKAKV